ncbi:MAG: phosphoribosylaminoimidazolesuccinocarboxamide synthase, partial [Sphingobacteriia bacterium]
NLVGHAWRTYSAGQRLLCGAKMPEGLVENDFFPEPIITPSTKADQGHDEDISPAEIIQRGLATEKEWEDLAVLAKKLFKRGVELAAERGLILADTKYEFGKIGEVIYLMDEIHTPDSSRYFYADGFAERQAKGEKQKQLSKEFVREWLMENGFMGKAGQVVPEMSTDWIQTISQRYIELFEKVTGSIFIPDNSSAAQVEEAVVHQLIAMGIQP